MKPRKPIDRRPKCKHCRDRFVPFFQNTDQKYCMKKDECIKAHADHVEEKRWKQKKTDMQHELKTHSDWSKELQIEINTIVRLIDKGSVCISSLKPLNEKYDAGHRFSVGVFPALRFHLFNIYSQSVHDNQYNSGNPDGFDKGLETIYGAQHLGDVHFLKIQYPSLKLTIPELIAAKSRAKKIVKDLKAMDLVYPPNVRKELRKKYNEKLGIYK